MIESQITGDWWAFEGNDGSGKSTMVDMLVNRYEDLSYKVVKTREPGGNPHAEALRKLIFSTELTDDPRTQLFEFIAARRRNILSTILPAWRERKLVISDRSEGSTFVYQGFQLGLTPDLIKSLNDFATEGIRPTLTILLDVDCQTGIDRVRQAKPTEENHFDQADMDNWLRRRDGYLELAQNYRKYGMNPWVIVDANGSVDQVFHGVWMAIMKGVGK